MRRIDLPVDELVRRYEAGEGTQILARAYGVDQMTVWHRLHAAGVKMRNPGRPKGRHKRGGSLHVTGSGYLGTYNRERKQCYIHRACWEAHNGPIPDGHVVHHRNKDHADHRIENLTCMTHGEHMRLHKSPQVPKEYKCT